MAGRLWLCACRAGPVLVTGEAWRKPWLTAVSQAQAKFSFRHPRTPDRRTHRCKFNTAFTGKVFISLAKFSFRHRHSAQTDRGHRPENGPAYTQVHRASPVRGFARVSCPRLRFCTEQAHAPVTGAVCGFPALRDAHAHVERLSSGTVGRSSACEARANSHGRQ